MSRPLFGPARRTLGDPKTTAYLDSLMTDEERDAQRIRERNEELYLAGIKSWFERSEPSGRSMTEPLDT